MLTSCTYCNKIHDNAIMCKEKEEKINTYKRNVSKADRFRWTQVWQRKRREINERDNFLCQVCIRELYDTRYKYNHEGISVHHIIPIVKDWKLRLDNNNLICLCSTHHRLSEDGNISVEELKDIVLEQEKKLMSENYTPLLF